MSDFLHSFLTASQYIAPLMANFDTSAGVHNKSEILYVKEGKGTQINVCNICQVP